MLCEWQCGYVKLPNVTCITWRFKQLLTWSYLKREKFTWSYKLPPVEVMAFSIWCYWFQLSSVEFSWVQFSSVEFSSVEFSSVEFSSVQFSSVQFSSVQLSSVQLSSVQLSSVEFSSVQFSWVQFSWVQFSSVQFSLLNFIKATFYLSNFSKSRTQRLTDLQNERQTNSNGRITSSLAEVKAKVKWHPFSETQCIWCCVNE